MNQRNEMSAAEYNEYKLTGVLPDGKKDKKQHKYRAEPQEYDGHKFASKSEMRRYIELKQMQQQKIIRDLVLQPRYPIRINGVLVTTYVGDFRYTDTETGETILEDVKGFVTQTYKLKRKLMRVVNGIEIQEIRP